MVSLEAHSDRGAGIGRSYRGVSGRRNPLSAGHVKASGSGMREARVKAPPRIPFPRSCADLRSSPWPLRCSPDARTGRPPTRTIRTSTTRTTRASGPEPRNGSHAPIRNPRLGPLAARRLRQLANQRSARPSRQLREPREIRGLNRGGGPAAGLRSRQTNVSMAGLGPIRRGQGGARIRPPRIARGRSSAAPCSLCAEGARWPSWPRTTSRRPKRRRGACGRVAEAD
jgi:hypothetical protein